jgi:hypothetical protein
MLFCIIYNVLSTLLQLCCCFFIVSGVVILYLKFTSSWEMSCIISLPSLGGTTNGSFALSCKVSSIGCMISKLVPLSATVFFLLTILWSHVMCYLT